jgi:Protein of unknown function (DUF1761)
MDSMSINWLAVLVATLSAFVLGWIWYSRMMFGQVWMKQSKLSVEEIQKGNKGMIFGGAFVFILIMAINLAFFLGSDPSVRFTKGLLYGFLTGVWIFCGIGVVALFEQKKAGYILINGGYMLVMLSLMGAIIGAWK